MPTLQCDAHCGHWHRIGHWCVKSVLHELCTLTRFTRSHRRTQERSTSRPDACLSPLLPPSLASSSGLHARSDPMLAIYPGGGARFQKHVDNSAKDGRKLTAVCYLNPAWQPVAGGALRVYPLHGPALDVYPQAGRVVLFFSDQIPHEVFGKSSTNICPSF